MPTLSFDGRLVDVPVGTMLLAAARQAGCEIPTLCDHPALEPVGGCRLCLVEITRPSWQGWRKLVVSCMYPAEDGLEVFTASEQVLATRRVILDLLLARCPNVPLVRELAQRDGVLATSYTPNPARTDCVLCGRCVRVCARIGAAAIASQQRGTSREVGPPFHLPPTDCVGCLSCARICPTGCIPFTATGHQRTIWGREFHVLGCSRCGAPTITAEMAAFFAPKLGRASELFLLCEACKRQELAKKIIALAS